ncbi:hypothetical protein SAMN05421863_101162 [Nitrosomonas communis]|uniref:Uncharacterized protein n=1 Tax=Nitrosomonas communis TaxID=44574 RepID=A0A1I4MSA3_9PROT|nr:hypothetical protein SAMN05421863_101162 [Nitrosomonas communis]
MIYLLNFLACLREHFNPSQTNHKNFAETLLTITQYSKNCKENLTNTYESRADGIRLCKIRCTSFDEPTYHVEKQEASAGQYSDWSVQ